MNAEAVVALWVGGAGFVTGVIGIIVASLARHDAKKANELAERANGISEKANDLSKEANEISKSSAARDAERHDAKWEGRWVRPGIYALRNVGTSTTHAVRATVTVNDENKTLTCDILEAAEDLEFKFPRAERAHAEEKREERDLERRRAESQRPRQSLIGSTLALEPIEPYRTPPMHSIWIRVVWQTSLGTPKEIETTERFADIGPA